MDSELIRGLFQLTWTFQGISIAIIIFFYKFSIGKLDKFMNRAIFEEARRAEKFRQIQEDYEKVKPDRVDDLLLRLSVAETLEKARDEERREMLRALAVHSEQLSKLEADLSSISRAFMRGTGGDKTE
jgi:hypothetical protein